MRLYNSNSEQEISSSALAELKNNITKKISDIYTDLDNSYVKSFHARLEQRLTFLTSGTRDKPDRLRTLRNAMTWSYDLLQADEQRLFRHLAVFQGGFTLDAAEALAHADRRSRRRRVGPGRVPGRQELGATGRDDGRAALPHAGDDPRVRTGAACGSPRGRGGAAGARGVLLGMAERAAPEWWGSEPAVWLDRLEAEYDNLRAALAWAVDRASTLRLGYRLAIALHWFWRVRGPVSEGRRWMEALLADAGEVTPTLRAALLARAGDLATVQGVLPQAEARLDASIALAREIDDRPTLTFALGMRGTTAYIAGDYDLGKQLLEQSVTLARAAAVPLWEALGTTMLAVIAHQLGDDARATALVEEAHATCAASRIAWVTALALHIMAYLAAERGDFAARGLRCTARTSRSPGRWASVASSPAPSPGLPGRSPRGVTSSARVVSVGRWRPGSTPPG